MWTPIRAWSSCCDTRNFVNYFRATPDNRLLFGGREGRTDLNPWKDFDWPAIPGHVGKPWFLPLVGAWYRLKDWLQ